MRTVRFHRGFDKCPDEIKCAIEAVAREPETKSIWLFGSRVNDCAGSKSDWDILVFRNDPCIAVPRRMAGLDVLRVSLSGDSLLEGMSESFVQSFARFEWSAINHETASYVGQKFTEVEGVRDASVPLVVR